MKLFHLLLVSSITLLSSTVGGSRVTTTNYEDGTTMTATKYDSTSSSSSGNKSAPPKKKQPAIQLDTRNFDSKLRDGNKWLIEFYAPWCGHCKRFAADYEIVANRLHELHDMPSSDDSEDTRKVMVGKVDGAAERALASRFGIRGYPSFYLIDGFTVTPYEGDRSIEKLVKFATKTHKDMEPMPFLNSPFGPLGQVRSIMMIVGSKIMDAYNYLVENKGFSPGMSVMILGNIGVVVGVILLITIGLLTEPKPKQD